MSADLFVFAQTPTILTQWFLGALAAVAAKKNLVEMIIRPKLSLKHASKGVCDPFFF
jgi:hypothetical protein